jgi:hypothetical protein
MGGQYDSLKRTWIEENLQTGGNRGSSLLHYLHLYTELNALRRKPNLVWRRVLKLIKTFGLCISRLRSENVQGNPSCRHNLHGVGPIFLLAEIAARPMSMDWNYVQKIVNGNVTALSPPVLMPRLQSTRKEDHTMTSHFERSLWDPFFLKKN